MPLIRRVTAAGLALCLAATTARAQAPTLDSLRARWTVQLPPSYLDLPLQPRSLPSMNASSPSAYSPEWGDTFFGVGYQRNTRPYEGSTTLNKEDGVAGVGFGLGASRLLALEVAYDSFSTIRSGFFNVGAFSFKLSHLFNSGLAVATGVERAFYTGSGGDGGRAYFGAASKVFFRGDGEGFLGAIGVTVGLGNGRFRRIADVYANRQTVNAFAAVGVRLAGPLGVVADWNGQDLNLSASIVPFRCLHLVISPGLADVTGSAGSPMRFVIGAGIGIRPAEFVSQVRSCF